MAMRAAVAKGGESVVIPAGREGLAWLTIARAAAGWGAAVEVSCGSARPMV